MNEDSKFQELVKRVTDLERAYGDLRSAYYANNFPSSQDFNKYVRFNYRVKVPNYTTLPSTCEIGEIAEQAGDLYICSAADTWTIAGTQS